MSAWTQDPFGPPAPPPGVDERLRRVGSLTDVALSRLDLDDLFPELLDRVRDVLDADTAAVLLLDETQQFLEAVAARGIEEEVRQGVRIPVGAGFAGRIAAERRPVIIQQVSRGTVVNPVLIRKGIQSMLGVPLLDGDALLGVLHVGMLKPREFTDDEVTLLELAADRVALATAASRARMTRAAASALQRSLAPSLLPTRPGLDIAARYVPGSQAGVGGDWYDVFALPGDRLGVVIGDVMGHGLRAATVMGRLRSVLRAYALDHDDPARVLEQVDRNVAHFEPGEMSTIVYAVLDRCTTSARICSAGHLPPALVAPGTSAELVSLPVGVPLGVHAGATRRCREVALPPGAMLCLFTDGLVEWRGGDIDVALDQVRAVLTAAGPGTAEAACAELMAALVADRQPDDDISLLVLKLAAGEVPAG